MTENLTDRELQNLRQENERLRNLLSLLSDLTLKINSTLDLSTVLQSVVDAACSLINPILGTTRCRKRCCPDCIGNPELLVVGTVLEDQRFLAPFLRAAYR